MSDKETPVVREFADIIKELDRGRVHNELGDRLHELIAAAQDTGKGGSITLTIGVVPDSKTQMLRFATKVVGKMPAAARAESLFFVDKNGNPTRQDPHQIALFEANEAARKAAAEQAANVTSINNVPKEA
ncbi:hypothetical protein QNA23_10780 [Rhodococcus erythropolis]|uniref:hypothetical protein n=1 Tax=Rhodococcus erythropolis TaxID=1833 RepID=UPI0024B8C803|nr:hypothetical protein [Rhodococcus erythropolis]MDJ0403967.1 hypothetical protein [Rhodococcus erythropolis]